MVEIYGPESSGKTTLALCTRSPKRSETVRHLRLHRRRARARSSTTRARIGVETDKLLVSQPDTGEQALDICRVAWCEAARSICVIVDSVAALTPKAEIEGDMGDSHMGLQARLMGQALRKLTADRASHGDLPHLPEPAPA